MTSLIMPDDFLTVEKQVELEIKKFNIADAAIAQLKEKYGSLEIADKNDSEGYEIVRKARAEVRGYRTGVEKKRKELKSDYLIIGRAIDGEAARLTELLSPLENSLDSKLNAIDSQIEEEKRLAEEQRLKKKNERIAELGRRRMVYYDGKYRLNDLSIDALQIEFASDEVFQMVIDSVEVEFQKELAKEKELERLKKAEEERLIQEREELNRMRAEQAQKEAEIQAEQQRLQKEREQQEAANRAEQQRLEKVQADLQEQKIKHRSSQLHSLGMRFDFDYRSYVFEDVNVDAATEITLFDDKQWADLIAKITPVIEHRKKSAELKRMNDFEIAKREAIEKANRERQEKELQAKLAEQERLALASDRQKFAQVILDLKGIVIPEMKSAKSKRLSAEIQSMINQAIELIESNTVKANKAA